MVQETGETRDAIIEADNRLLQQILDANKHRKDIYWIVVFAKPAKVCVDGKFTLIKHIKPYSVKPHSQVGLICGEVDNSKGKIKWEFNMPQSPFDFDALPGLKSLARQEVVTETTTIAGAYITQ